MIQTSGVGESIDADRFCRRLRRLVAVVAVGIVAQRIRVSVWSVGAHLGLRLAGAGLLRHALRAFDYNRIIKVVLATGMTLRGRERAKSYKGDHNSAQTFSAGEPDIV